MSDIKNFYAQISSPLEKRLRNNDPYYEKLITISAAFVGLAISGFIAQAIPILGILVGIPLALISLGFLACGLLYSNKGSIARNGKNYRRVIMA